MKASEFISWTKPRLSRTIYRSRGVPWPNSGVMIFMIFTFFSVFFETSIQHTENVQKSDSFAPAGKLTGGSEYAYAYAYALGGDTPPQCSSSTAKHPWGGISPPTQQLENLAAWGGISPPRGYSRTWSGLGMRKRVFVSSTYNVILRTTDDLLMNRESANSHFDNVKVRTRTLTFLSKCDFAL